MLNQAQSNFFLHQSLPHKYQKHTDHNLGIHLQYADHSQWMHRATLPMGVNDGGENKRRKEKKKRKERRFLELPRPRAGS